MEIVPRIIFPTENDVNIIIKKYTADPKAKFVKFQLLKASDNIMGFLSEYWKLQVNVKAQSGDRCLYFFIKSIDRNNASKAAMVKELKLFEKEAKFYKYIKPSIDISESQPWSAKLAAVFENDLVLEDLTALGYRLQPKLEPFDLQHCKIGLECIARFHAGSLIYNETATSSDRERHLLQDFKDVLDKGGYTNTNPWFDQCMRGSIEAVKEFSKYGRNCEQFAKIESQWKEIWWSALDLSNAMEGCANVICHRDLWNNNLLYRYDASGSPDRCVLVDFQAVRLQPPAGDVMLFLYCSNIDSNTLEKELPNLLLHYHNHLSRILNNYGISMDGVLPIDDFLRTAEEQRKWGLILSCCLRPQIWMNDDKMTEICTDSERFDKILTKNKGDFIRTMMADSSEYREKVLERFEEVVWRYIL